MKQDEEDPQLAANATKIRRHLKQDVTSIKVGLTAWLEGHNRADAVAVSIALMEAAIDRYLVTYGEDDALEMMQSVFRKAVEKQRGPLQ